MDMYSGVRWSAVAAWAQQAIQFGISIVLAHLLLPQDYGLLAMATVFVGFLATFRTMGFGLAVVQRREVSDSLLSSLYFVSFAVAGLLAVAAVAAAPVCAWVYRDPRVTPIMAVLAINFVLSAPAIIPSAVLTRRMSFDRIAVAQLLPPICGGGVAIALAASGWGVWSLVMSSLVGSAIGTGLLHLLCPWRPRLIFRWSEVRSAFGFGANVTGFDVFNYFARNADNFIIGAFLGAQPLGYYSLAYDIMLKPRDAVTGVLTRVLFPAFSRMQQDDDRLKAAYLRTCGAIAFVTFPMMFGLLAIVHPFVEVVLGAKWLPAVPVICLFAPLGALQSVWSSVGQVFLAKGRADWYFRWGVAGGILFIGSFFAGLPWGIVGVALSYTVTCTVWSVVSFWIAFKLVAGLNLGDLGRVLRPYVFAAGAMALLVSFCRLGLEIAGVSQPVVLLLCVMVGILSYAGMMLIAWPPAADDILRLIPGPIGGKLRRLVQRPQSGPDHDKRGSVPQESICAATFAHADRPTCSQPTSE